MAFDYWDNFDFDNSSQNEIDQMIYQGASMGQSMGLSQTRTKDELRGRGFSFSNAKFSSLWNSINDDRLGFKHFTEINKDSFAIDDLLPQTNQMETRYRYIARFDSSKPDHPTPLWVTGGLDSNKQLTPTQAYEQIRDMFMKFYGASLPEMDTIQIQGVLFNPSIDID